MQRSVEGLGVDRAAHLELLLIVLSDVLVARDFRAVAALLRDAALPVLGLVRIILLLRGKKPFFLFTKKKTIVFLTESSPPLDLT